MEEELRRHRALGQSCALLLDRGRARALAGRLSAALAQVDATASVGLAVLPDDGRIVDELLRAADEAEREAKRLRLRAAGPAAEAGVSLAAVSKAR